jgi:hypothetical protein
MAETVERLIATLEADVTRFEKGMKQAYAIFDKQAAAVEKRQASMMARLNAGFGLKGIGSAILGGAALVGLERFVSSVAETATKLQSTAQAIGVSTDALQEWGAIASHAGVGQDEFNTALARFSKNLGDAQVKGGEMARLLTGLGVDIKSGPEAAFLQFSDAIAQTGNQQQKVAIVTALMGRDAAKLVPILQQGSAAIKAQGDELKRNGAIIDAEAIRKIDELDKKWVDLKREFTATGANVLSGFADEFSDFADELKSPEFQNAMRAFGADLAFVVSLLTKAAAFMPEIVGGLAGLAVGGPVGGLVGVGLGAATAIGTGYNGPKPKTAADLPFAPSWFQGQAGTKDRAGLLSTDNGAKLAAKAAEEAAKAYQELVKAIDAGNVEILQGTLGRFAAIRKQITDDTAAELQTIEFERAAKEAALDDENKNGKILAADLAKAKNSINEESASKESAVIARSKTMRLQAAREEFDARFNAEQAIVELRRETVKSQSGLLLELAQGTQDYYKLARDLSDEQAKLDEQNIRDRLAHELEAMDRQKADVDKSSQEWKDYQQERADAVTAAELKITQIQNGAAATRHQLTEQETHALEYQIQTMDKVRSGLEDVAAAGIHGFKSLKDAAVQFVEQLADMALRLYVIRPLLESVFGRAGTNGDFLSGLLGFGGSSGGSPLLVDSVNVTPGLFPARASGGPVSAGQPYLVGEKRPELFVPSTSGMILPQVPAIRAGGAPTAIHLSTYISLDGANGDETVRKIVRQGVLEGMAINAANLKRQFPGLMVAAQQHNL